MLCGIFLVSGFAMRTEDEQSRNQDDGYDQKDHESDQKIHHRGSHGRGTARVVTDDKSLNGGHDGGKRSGHSRNGDERPLIFRRPNTG